MRLYFVRHGESEANTHRIISNREMKHGLTELGRQQAREMAQTFSRVPVAALHASPIWRAVQTAEIVSSVLGLPFEVANALREPDCGVLEGRSDDAAWAEHRRVMVDWLLHEKFDSRIEGGESYQDVRARFVPFIDRLTARHGHTTRNLVMIAHGSLLYTMLPVVLSNIDLAYAREQPMPNTAVIVAETYANDLRCVSWCGAQVAA
jgi:probable phosphoglycerate mutase